MMVMRRVRRWDHFRAGPARSGLRTCREISGDGAALLIWCLNRAQASHFIEDAFRVQLAFQPLERAIHWFAFSNNDFWHQFTSIPKKFAHSNPGREQFTPAVYAASNRVREGPFRRP